MRSLTIACRFRILPLLLACWTGFGMVATTASGQTYVGHTYLYNRLDNIFNDYRGYQPFAVVSADFNADGMPDLAVANHQDSYNYVDILLGQSDGTFAGTFGHYATGADSDAIIAADFNGDGKLDLAIVDSNCLNQWDCHGQGMVSVLLGNGDGTFQNHVDYTVGNIPVGIVAADFNGDGKIDLAVVNENDNTVSILLGNGDGTFQIQSTVAVGTGPVALSSGDFNGDGRVDLVTSNSGSGDITVLISNGNGTFNRTDLPAGGTPAGIVTGDFNNDGYTDIVAALSNTNAVILLGNGNGTFQSARSIPSAPAAYLVVAGDFNNDGKLDLAFGQAVAPEASVIILSGNGDGTFQETSTSTEAGSPSSLLVADFNGDGKPDLAVTFFTTNWAPPDQLVSILLGNGNGTFDPSADFSLGQQVQSVGPLVVTDLNGDGHPDVAWATASGSSATVSVFLGDGKGGLGSPIVTSLNYFSTTMVAGDFNGDGKMDLALNGQNENPYTVTVLPGNGDGSFGSPVNTTLPPSLAPVQMVAGDFNGDSNLDLAVVTSGAQGYALTIYFGQANGLFTAGQTVATSPTYPMYAAAGDFNGDGKLDLAYAVQIDAFGGAVYVFLGNGDGTFTSTSSYSLQIPNGPPVVQNVDNDGSGTLDLVTPIYFPPAKPGGFAVLTGNGNGTFQVWYFEDFVSDGEFPGQVVAADFSGDGNPDVVVDVPFSIMINNGFLTFQTPRWYADGQGGIRLGSGDFNSDGVPDLVVGTSAAGGNGFVTLFLSAPLAAFRPSPLNFGSQLVGLPFPPQTITLTNVGNAPLTIGSVAASGPYTQSNTCTQSLAPLANCPISVTFTPLSQGSQPGSLSVTDNAVTSPQVIALTGNGIYDALAELSPTSVSFARQAVGTSSSAVQVTLTNTGNLTLSITGLTFSGADDADFQQTNTCGGSVSAGNNCAIDITFTPLQEGIRTATLNIADNASGSPQTVSLSGIGGILSESPTNTVDFYGDGEGEPAVFRPSTGTWYVDSNGGKTVKLHKAWGTSGDVPVAADYDGDGKDDFAVWRPSTGTWYIIPSGGGKNIVQQSGSPGDVPVPADYDGDGKTDIAVWRPSNGTWYIIPSGGGPNITKQWGSPGDVPVIGDFDGDRKADYAFWRPSNGTWYVSLSSTGQSVTTVLGNPGDIPVEGGYDGDGKTDYAVWRPSNGTWYVVLSGTGQQVTEQSGMLGDIPVVGDYNADGKNDYAVFRPSNGTWYINYSSSGTSTVQYGTAGDIPATHLPSMYLRDKHIANFDGDRKADVAVWRPSNGTWYVIFSSTGKSGPKQWGTNGDIPVPGDYDGDGKTDYAVWRPSNQTWYVIFSSTGKSGPKQWGASGDIPVPGDYDGDGKTDYAVWQPSNQTWNVILSSTGQQVSQKWGISGDIPVPADYDGDGRTDYAVFRPSTATWYVLLSSTGKTMSQQWGANGDTPAPGDYDGDTKADFTVFRPSTGTWYTLQSSNGETVTTTLGMNGDTPVAKDYDGDEKTDFAVFRPSNGTWYILQSSNGQVTTTVWGVSTDVPVNKPTGQ